MTEAAEIALWRHLFGQICVDMGEILIRSAFSANIKERRDCSCALFTKSARLFAQAPHIPVHLGAMGDAVSGILAAFALSDGDVAITNDPFRGGTHLPDITLTAPLFHRRKPLFFIANRAHHADIGGSSPGSMASASTIHQEGLIIPPLLLVEKGRLRADIMQLICANSRMPDERRRDIDAQLAAINYAKARLKELVRRHGADRLLSAAEEQIDYTRRYTKALIQKVPEKPHRFRDFIETEEGPAAICVTLWREGSRLVLDFGGSSPQVGEGINATAAVTRSCVAYVLLSLLGGDVPPNAGVLEDVELRLPPASIVNACYPAAVAGGNVETSQRIVDVLLGAFGEAGFEVPAASCGTMANIAVGGGDFAHYETIGGGAGASRQKEGTSAVHCHMTNTLNTPVEALERRFPLEVVCYRVRRGSGGAGLHRGGDGIVRHIRLLRGAEVSLLVSRTERGPWGLEGGGSGKPAAVFVKRSGRWRRVDGRARLVLSGGDEIRVETPGGGGWGRP